MVLPMSKDIFDILKCKNSSRLRACENIENKRISTIIWYILIENLIKIFSQKGVL